MSKGLCGADCSACQYKERCRGCAETGGCPFGKQCAIAKYILVGGMDKYLEFKRVLIEELNALEVHGMEKIEELYPLVGRYVNLEYILPSGQKVKLLNDDEMYLGNQLKNVYAESSERCYGVVACASLLLVCEYGEGGSNPEIVIFKRR